MSHISSGIITWNPCLSLDAGGQKARWNFAFLTPEFFDSVVDERSGISFSLEGSSLGKVSYMHGYEAADNGGENSQPILSCTCRGEFTDTGLHLSLNGQLGGYNARDLGNYGEKHEPCTYEYVFDLTWSEFIDRICAGYPFANRHRFMKDVVEPKELLATSHRFYMGRESGLVLHDKECDLPTSYCFDFLNGDFLKRALHYPDYKCNVLIAGDILGFKLSSANNPEKKEIGWEQPIKTCRILGFVDTSGLKLSMSGSFGETVDCGEKIHYPPKRFKTELTCSNEDLPALLGFRMLLKDRYFAI